MPGENILVVDDDHGLLTLMRVRLEAAGYRAVVAEGAEQALSRELDDPYDMAIIDLKLNGMNGMTLLEKLGRVCKFGSALYTIAYEPRRFDQHTMGAAATTAPTPKTQDRATRP
jgi:DNA-binding NtrC family response regulator